MDLPVLTPGYTPCNDLWVVTAYFNPRHYRTRRANYDRFVAPIRAARIRLLSVECAFGNDPFELPPGPAVVHVRAPHVLWQKERLINLGVAHLPPEAAKVAWLDGDILFTNPDWAARTSTWLDKVPVVQPFARVFRLPENADTPRPEEQGEESFASVWQRDQSRIRAGGLDVHGHTGFAWAARRDLLARFGLYEAALNGNADHLIAHAMAGDANGPCIAHVTSSHPMEVTVRRFSKTSLFAWARRVLPPTVRRFVSRPLTRQRPHPPYRDHFLAWAQPFAQAVQGTIGCVPGTLLHLWHGDDIGDRGHGSGRIALFRHQFDPARDLRVGSSGCLEWATDKPELKRWAEHFFATRREDG